jgi:hypothetical protein
MLKSLISKGLSVPHRCENRYNALFFYVNPDQLAILILRFHDIKTLAPRGVNNS